MPETLLFNLPESFSEKLAGLIVVYDESKGI